MLKFVGLTTIAFLAGFILMLGGNCVLFKYCAWFISGPLSLLYLSFWQTFGILMVVWFLIEYTKKQKTKDEDDRRTKVGAQKFVQVLLKKTAGRLFQFAFMLLFGYIIHVIIH